RQALLDERGLVGIVVLQPETAGRHRRRQRSEHGPPLDHNCAQARPRGVESSRRAEHAAADDDEVSGWGEIVGKAHRNLVSSSASGSSASELRRTSAWSRGSWLVSGFGTATQYRPARFAARMPLGESSIAMA